MTEYVIPVQNGRQGHQFKIYDQIFFFSWAYKLYYIILYYIIYTLYICILSPSYPQ